MSLSRIEELVSQAESEGVTLASLISRYMTPEEISDAQHDLASAIAVFSSRTQDFMAGVEVPSVWEIMEQDESDSGDASAAEASVVSDS